MTLKKSTPAVPVRTLFPPSPVIMPSGVKVIATVSTSVSVPPVPVAPLSLVVTVSVSEPL